MSVSSSSLSVDLSSLSVRGATDSQSLQRSPSDSLPSPLGTPTRPKRSPLRMQSNGSLRETAQSQNGQMGVSQMGSSTSDAEVRILLFEVAKLQDRMYEIQELRHSTSAPLERLNTLLSDMASRIADLTPRIDAIILNSVEAESRISSRSSSQSLAPHVISDSALDELRVEWSKALKDQGTLAEEVKEDGWLIRFRTTADQAEAMMDPLEKSQDDLLNYVDKISGSPYEVPYAADIHGGLSITDLIKLQSAHESMKSTYVPSIIKILKMMDRSLTDRSTKNGESLRRYGDMVTRWTGLQRTLAQLDARVQLVLSQYELDIDGAEDVEVLDDNSNSPSDRLRVSDDEYFGAVKSRPSPHRQSSSSGHASSSSSPLAHSRPTVSPGPNLALPGESLRRKSSMTSTVSVSTPRLGGTDKPRWNISTKINYDASQSHGLSTPITKRMSFGYTGVGSPRTSLIGRASSPTPSSMSGLTSNSRIPVAVSTPRRAVSGASYGNIDSPPIPGLSVSTTTTHMSLSDPSTTLTPPSQSTGYRLPQTTHTSRLSLPRSATAPHGQSLSVPRARLSRGGGGGMPPPSSFRPTTPSRSPHLAYAPSLTPSRPSSRLSMNGAPGGFLAPSSARGPAQYLKPFQPSKYDLLDQSIAQIIAEEGFDLFVARLDPPLKRGQRKVEGEEWKGEFVFGAGERSSSVKLLTIAASAGAGRSKAGNEKDKDRRVRCLVRKGGMWVNLAELLRERKEKHGEVF